MHFLDLKKINSLHHDEIMDKVSEVVASGWYIQGQPLHDFEVAYSQFIGTSYTIGVGNGLDAIDIIFRSYIELGKMNAGDEVIIPANTFIASVLAVISAGLKPVFVDTDPSTLLMDESRIEEMISEKTKALMIVHLYGKCAYSDKIKNICENHGLLLVEDNAQAHGCRYGNKRTGSLGNAAAHSFYPSKNLGAMGDAGAITTDDIALASVARKISNYGFQRKYHAPVVGRNSRMDNIQAAILNVKLKYLDEENRKRKEVARKYDEGIKNPFIILPENLFDNDNVYHLYPILTKFRNQLQDYLKDMGIETIIHYPVPPHKQTCFPQYNHISLPMTERMADMELSIPISQVMTDKEVQTVIDALNSFTKP